METRLKKNIIFALCVLVPCAVAIAFMYFSGLNGTSGVATITIAGGESFEIPLDTDKIYEYTTDTGSAVSFVIEVDAKSKSARFINSVCPDGLCENYGWIDSEYEQAICLPAGVILGIGK